MPKYYCDYCDTFLTHDSPSVRKTHCNGRKHKENVRFYYQKWMEEQAQNLIDVTTAAFKANKAMVPPAFALKGPNGPPIPGLPPGIRFPPGAPPPPPIPIPPGRLPLLPNMPPGVPPMIPMPPTTGMIPPVGPLAPGNPPGISVTAAAAAGVVPPAMIPGQPVPNPLPPPVTGAFPPIPGQPPIRSSIN